MNEKDFADLLASIKQAGEIKKGVRRPERVFERTMKPDCDFSLGNRGAIDTSAHGKTKTTMQLDEEILDWFREQVEALGAGNYQTLINDVLLAYVREQRQRGSGTNL